ncbi:MAG: hypothetical protein N3C60_09130, partial [Calditerrivibrio sp.]|nr:hypothetical protein [Calditerrivibrio sp.]
VKEFLGRFFYSTSKGGIYFGLLYILLLVVFSNFIKLRLKVSKFVIPVLLAMFYLLGLVLNFYYYHKFDINWSERVIQWYDFYSNSFNSIFHNHILKPLNYILLGFIPAFSVKYDLGSTFVSFYSEYFFIFLAIIYVVLMLLPVVMSYQIMLKYDFKMNIFILFAVSISYSLKSITDGGVLSGYTIVAYFIVFNLMLMKDKREFDSFWRRKYYFLILLFIFNVLIVLFRFKKDDLYFGDLVFIYIFFLLLIYWDCLKKRQFVVIVVVAYFFFSIFFSYFTTHHCVFERGDFYVYSISSDLEIKRLSYYSVSPYQIYLSFLEDIYKTKKILIFDRDSKGSFLISLQIIPLYLSNRGIFRETDIISLKSINKTDNERLKLTFEMKIPHYLNSNERCDLVVKNNFYVILHTINNYLQMSGFKEYIMILK